MFGFWIEVIEILFHFAGQHIRYDMISRFEDQCLLIFLEYDVRFFRNLFAIESRSESVSSGPRMRAISWIEQARVRFVCGSLTEVNLI